MRKASVRDLRYRFADLEGELREGKEIEITKRRRVIARLVPAKRRKRPKRPDFLARLRKIFGDKVLKVSGAELIAWDRDRL
jgi:antitoxin (DNA-binding transcriptional repressor) of toxin-antitoxin stability system